jgi:hypothetical protein
MKRFLLIGGAVLIAGAATVFVAAVFDGRQVFIPGEQPVTVDQVREKLVSEGWSNIQVSRKGRFIVAAASRNGEDVTIQVEALTGRLRITDDDEAVTDEDPER